MRLRLQVAAALVALSLSGGPALALSVWSDHKTDAEIAQYPVVVVARWDKVPLRGMAKRSRFEYETELTVLRTIKGPIGPGTHRVVLDT